MPTDKDKTGPTTRRLYVPLYALVYMTMSVLYVPLYALVYMTKSVLYVPLYALVYMTKSVLCVYRYVTTRDHGRPTALAVLGRHFRRGRTFLIGSLFRISHWSFLFFVLVSDVIMC